MTGYLEVTNAQLAKLIDLRNKEDIGGFNLLAASYGAKPHDHILVVHRQCFVHPDKAAEGSASVPCAPGGRMWLCGECLKPESAQAVFEAYRASHGKSIKAFKQVNKDS